MASTHDMEVAFDAALAQVERSIAGGMKTVDGNPAQPQLKRLERELKLQREESRKRGAVDLQWFQQTVRWVTEWVPDTEITLIAALGQIVRAVPRAMS